MFKPIKCWLCGSDMHYIYDKDTEELGMYAFDCSKCDEKVAVPKEAPFLEMKIVSEEKSYGCKKR